MGVFSVIEWLEKLGYGKFEVFDDMYVSKGKGLIISVQPPECWYSQKYPKGSIAAESLNTFNKWTQVYFQVELPRTKSARKRTLEVLNCLTDPYHEDRANRYLTFDDPDDPPKKKEKYQNRSRSR
jgi:hypothetical protein